MQPNNNTQNNNYQNNLNQQIPVQNNPPLPVQQANNLVNNVPNNSQSDPGKVFAILSIVFAFLTLTLVGFILGLIARSKSKKAGFKTTLATVGILLNIGIFVLFIIPFSILFGLTFYSNVVNYQKTSSFVNYVRDKNYEEAIKLTNVTSEEDKQNTINFLQGISPKLGTGQDTVNNGKKDGQVSYVYAIVDGTSKYIRVILTDGKVSNAIVSDNQPGLFPGDSSENNTVETTQQQAVTNSENSQSVCAPFVSADFTPLLSSASTIPNMTKFTENVFFKPDSTEYEYSTTSQVYQRIGNFDKSTNKQYKIVLTGSVYSDYNTDAGKSLAQQRSQKVKSDLETNGISSSKIVISAPKEYQYGQSSTYDPKVFRNVTLEIESDCSQNQPSGM